MLVKQSVEKTKDLLPENWKGILEELGYKFTLQGSNYRCRAIYRDGKSSNSLCIYPHNGTFYDFPEQRKGTILQLIALTKGVETAEILDTLEFQEKKNIPRFIDAFNTPRIFSDKGLSSLGKFYPYFLGRGISKKTQDKFEHYFATKGKFSGRIIFPMRNERNQIIGFSGRSINHKKDSEYPKWIHLGGKRFFIYNRKIAEPAIKHTKKCFLVESIGDLLALSQAGYDNALCLFGLNISSTLVKYLIGINPEKIIISTNLDENKRGQEGAIKIYKILSKFFSHEKLLISHPPENDWNDVLIKRGELSIQKELNQF